MRYKKVENGEWVKPKRKYYYMKCCDCGLVHKMEFALIGDKRKFIIFRAFRIDKRKELQ